MKICKEKRNQLLDAIYEYYSGGPTAEEVISNVLKIDKHPRMDEMTDAIASASREIEKIWENTDNEDTADDVVYEYVDEIISYI